MLVEELIDDIQAIAGISMEKNGVLIALNKAIRERFLVEQPNSLMNNISVSLTRDFCLGYDLLRPSLNSIDYYVGDSKLPAPEQLDIPTSEQHAKIYSIVKKPVIMGDNYRQLDLRITYDRNEFIRQQRLKKIYNLEVKNDNVIVDTDFNIISSFNITAKIFHTDIATGVESLVDVKSISNRRASNIQQVKFNAFDLNINYENHLIDLLINNNFDFTKIKVRLELFNYGSNEEHSNNILLIDNNSFYLNMNPSLFERDQLFMHAIVLVKLPAFIGIDQQISAILTQQDLNIIRYMTILEIHRMSRTVDEQVLKICNEEIYEWRNLEELKKLSKNRSEGVFMQSNYRFTDRRGGIDV